MLDCVEYVPNRLTLVNLRFTIKSKSYLSKDYRWLNTYLNSYKISLYLYMLYILS